jgi:hypothetical protein
VATLDSGNKGGIALSLVEEGANSQTKSTFPFVAAAVSIESRLLF